MKDYKLWYQKRKRELTQGGLWLRGEEINVSFDYDKFPILISRLSTYRDTALSITHGTLYQIARDLAGCAADFSYLPPPKDGRIMSSDKIPWLFGTTTKAPWSEFGLIAVSNSIVQELINLPVILEKSGIERSYNKRIDNESIPIIILGGANAANCSILMHNDSPVDVIFAGGDYFLIQRIFETVRDMKTAGKSKREICLALSNIDGAVLPDKSSTTKAYNSSDLNRQILTKGSPVFYGEETAGSGVVRISEGCQFLCSFCAESWQRKPYREADADIIVQKALELKQNCGFDSIDLYSFNFNMHSQIDKIVMELSKVFRSVGLKSQRFDMIAREPGMIEFMSEAGKSSITCGLEGISGRMRNYLCKSLSDEDLMNSLRAILNSNLRSLKIFIIATGIETDDDIREFTELCEFIGSFKTKKRIYFSITPLVRFPHTPLESEPAPEVDIIRSVVDKIAKVCRMTGFEFREAAEANEYFVSQILVRGDERVWSCMKRASKSGNFIYYDNVSQQFADDFRKELKTAGVNIKKILAGDNEETSYLSKAGRFDFGIKSGFLEKIRLKCLLSIIEPGSSGKDVGEKSIELGVCGDKERAIYTSPRPRVYDTKTLALIRRGAQREEKAVELRLFLAEGYKDIKRYAGTKVARAFMLAFPEIAKPYRAIRFVSAYGTENIYDMVFLPDGISFLSNLKMEDIILLVNNILEGIKLSEVRFK